MYTKESSQHTFKLPDNLDAIFGQDYQDSNNEIVQKVKQDKAYFIMVKFKT